MGTWVQTPEPVADGQSGPFRIRKQGLGFGLGNEGAEAAREREATRAREIEWKAARTGSLRSPGRRVKRSAEAM